MPVPDDPLLSAWHAVNCLREWRGDTHMALLVAAGLGPVEASLLHSAWVRYPDNWVAQSRMWNESEITAGFESLARRGLATTEPAVTAQGVELRQAIEDQTNELTVAPWQRLGEELSQQVADVLEPPCVTLLARVDETAGPRYQPASRLHAPWPRPA
jgi:hypothetical protein